MLASRLVWDDNGNMIAEHELASADEVELKVVPTASEVPPSRGRERLSLGAFAIRVGVVALAAGAVLFGGIRYARYEADGWEQQTKRDVETLLFDAQDLACGAAKEAIRSGLDPTTDQIGGVNEKLGVANEKLDELGSTALLPTTTTTTPEVAGQQAATLPSTEVPPTTTGTLPNPCPPGNS